MSDSDYDFDSDSEGPFPWEDHVEDKKRNGIDAWTGKKLPGYCPYDSDYDSEEESEKKLSVEEMEKILEVESQKSQYKHTDSVLYALKMYGISKLKGEWGKELIDFFWDMRNNPSNSCCHRHSQHFPSNPWDVKSLKGLNAKTVSEELEKQLVCSCNRRHLARYIVEVLNLEV